MSWADRIARALVEAAQRPQRLAPRDLSKDTLMNVYSHKVEDVPIPWLKALPGNQLRQNDEWLANLGRDITTRGMNNPLIISVGKESGTGLLGEGNHRLEALLREGYTHAPARVDVGREWGRRVMDPEYLRPDLIPQAGQYFKSDAMPSEVFNSLRDYLKVPQ